MLPAAQGVSKDFSSAAQPVPVSHAHRISAKPANRLTTAHLASPTITSVTKDHASNAQKAVSIVQIPNRARNVKMDSSSTPQTVHVLGAIHYV